MKFFFLTFLIIFSLLVGLSLLWPPLFILFFFFIPLFAIGVVDVFQKKHAIRRNFPIIGNLRYFFESIRPELQQYFVESNLSGRPVPREWRSVIYQRAKGQTQTLPFGTQQDLDIVSPEWTAHSIHPVHVDPQSLRVVIGGPDCLKPYSASLLNISAMSYGALGRTAITALNLGAKMGGFAHNTGEGGISPYHRSGGDLIWQIGTGYFGCRSPEGHFSEELFQEKSQWPEVKMIEIKISQGAKPSKGGLLPGSKVSEEIAQIRHIKMGETVHSPPQHSSFSNPIELMHFIKKLRALSGGKPIGFKLCIGRKKEFFALCKAMISEGILPDFITIDGSEGGTGAAPLEFSNSIGVPLNEGLSFAHDTLVGFGLRDRIRLIASGKVFTSFQLLTKIALGADLVNSARGMMLALGCIQALRCNTNHCPAGVATTHPDLERGLHVPSKSERVFKFHKETLLHFAELLGAMGYYHTGQIQRRDIEKKLYTGQVKTYEDLYPSVSDGSYQKTDLYGLLPQETQEHLKHSSERSFL